MDDPETGTTHCIKINDHTFKVRVPDCLRSDTQQGFAEGIRRIPFRLRAGATSYRLLGTETVDEVCWWTVEVQR